MHSSAAPKSHKQSKFLRLLFASRESHRRSPRADTRHRCSRVEPLEDRELLSVAPVCQFVLYDASRGAAWTPPTNPADFHAAVAALGSSAIAGLTPAQIKTAYGITGDGAGQAIAIVEAYDNPALVGSSDPSFASSDLYRFDHAFTPPLPDPASFLKLNQTGGATLPAPDTKGWALEEALDVEWAHAIAPAASVILFEADDDSLTNLLTAVDTARRYPGVSVVSLGWSSAEFSGETAYDASFTTPVPHAGVTFVAPAGSGTSAARYPACSPNVVGVGGTTLTLTSGNYLMETGWSGGGPSAFETEPAYQNGAQNSGSRASPDVAFDADPATAVAVYDSYDGGASHPWYQVGGTSLGSTCWAGLVAIGDQLRSAQGLDPMDGRTDALPLLYSMSAADFHDVTNDTAPGGAGYDMVTGRGSPVANRLVPDFAPATPRGAMTGFQWSYVPASLLKGEPFAATVRAVDAYGTTVSDYSGPVNLTAYTQLPNIRVGTGASQMTIPLDAADDVARTQVIYLASEIGVGGTISALSLDVAAVPGQVLNNWTIRMKHTALSSYSTAAWEGPASGWTTVYQVNQSITTTGWATFMLTTPFQYDGVENLMIDFSFHNAATSGSGLCAGTNTASARCLYYPDHNGSFGNPLNWSGALSPSPSAWTFVPNVQLTIPAISVAPATMNFAGGAWTGAITLPRAVNAAYLFVDDGGGHTGLSSVFNVYSAPSNPGPANGAVHVSPGASLCWTGTQPAVPTDTVGSTSSYFTLAGDGTGDVYQVTAIRTLTQIEMYLGIAASTDLRFFVYQSASENGAYTKVLEKDVPASGTGTRWYGSGPISVLLSSGTYYYIGASWQGNSTYYYNWATGPVSFGSQLSGGEIAYPPPAATTNPGTTTAYYQRLTTVAETYDVYLDTTSPPVHAISQGTTQTTCDPGGLAGDTTFYWQIVAHNALGAAPSPVWQFTTVALPTSTIAYPADGASYNAASWSGSICGTCSASSLPLSQVQVSIQRLSDDKYWDGTSFGQSSEFYVTAAGTTAWSVSFPHADFPEDDVYRIHARGKDTDGNVEAGPTVTFIDDTTPPEAMAIEDLANDTGIGHNDDLITTDPTLLFDGTPEVGGTVQYAFSYDHGATWSAWDGNNPVPQGAQTPLEVKVRQIDEAGNKGPESAPFSYTLDAPAVSSEYPSVTTVTTAQVGDTFIVTVYYNEPMWMLPAVFSPTVSFTGSTPEETAAINATLTNGVKQWDNSLRFEEDFQVENAGVYVPHVNIGVAGGYDAVGNQPAPFQSTDDFAINMQVTPPTVIYAQASIQRVSLCNVSPGTDAFQVHIKYDPADGPLNTMLLASRPTITFVADTPELTAQANATLIPDLANSTWSGSGSDYIAYYNVVNTGAVIPNVDMKIAGAQGAYSYVAEQWYDQERFLASGAFSIDTTKCEPLVSVQSTWGTYQLVTNAAASPHPDPLPEGEGTAPAYWVRINYAHPMSIGIQPTVTLNGSTPAETSNIQTAMHFSYGTWTSTQTYMAYYTVNGGTDVPMTGVYVGAAGAHDLVGNLQVPLLSTTPVFDLDTHDATPDLSDVTNLGSSMSSITAHEIGSQLYLEIVYSQTMDISNSPTFQFLDGAGNPTGVPGATVYQNYPSSFWGSDHVYWAFFDIQNPYAGQDPPGIIFRNVGVQVSGARDITGRDQTTYQKLKIFDIDTLTPDVASLPSAATVAPNIGVITDANTGEAKFYVRIDYDRPMWGGLAPEVSFVPDPNTTANITALANTLTPFADYSGWGNYDPASHGYTTYWQWYSVTDVNASIPFIGVKIRGAVDMTANPQQWFEGSGFRVGMLDEALPQTALGQRSDPSHTDAVLASGALSLGLTPSPSSTNQESAALTPADYALLYSGTWLEA